MRKQIMSRLSWLLVIVGLAVSSSGVAGDKPQQAIPDPGYRPDGYYQTDFAEALDTATIAVLPTIVRRAERSACSFDSQQQILDSLGALGIAAVNKPRRVDPGPLRRSSQWEIFRHGASSVSETLATYDTGADFTLVMEILVPDSQAVFGIEVYIVNAEGQHVLSFLLNSHHQVFADAGLKARNSSEEARSKMIAKATSVGLAALQQQLDLLRG